ncbi:NXPE family member 4-like [Antedon mediterranea]|uniref:NXPE family member 4-like n=1 Tax=Antedon mediterranea TaxID=105859 RepID=UPI003AF4D47B
MTLTLKKLICFLFVTSLAIIGLLSANSRIGVFRTTLGVYMPVTVYKSVKTRIPRYQVVKTSRISKGVQHTYMARSAGTMGLPDVSKTKLRINNTNIRKGEFFSFFVDFKDKFGRQRIKGGDFIFATIDINGTRSTGKVIDFDNGTYEVIFLASSEGKATPTIQLVHPQEAVYYLENIEWPVEDRVYWIGSFIKNKLTETSSCAIKRVGSWVNKCEYAFPEALGGVMFICNKPKTLPCDSLISTRTDKSSVGKNFQKVPKNVVDNYFSKNVRYAVMKNQFHIIINSSTDPNVNRDLVESFDLPVCKGILPSTLSDGFWTGEVWHSLVCKTKQWSPSEIRRCVRGKHLILMGDSTTRQWGEVLVKTLNLSTKITFQYIEERSDTLNLTFYFHPFIIGVQHTYKLAELHFEVDILKNLVGCDYYIVISPWAHYTQWARDSYIERLQLLKIAVLHFKERCPDTPVVLKSPHPRDHTKLPQFIYGSDYLIHRLRQVMKSVFADTDVFFMDVWDLVNSYHSQNEIHMPSPVILQKLYIFFSHVCKF